MKNLAISLLISAAFIAPAAAQQAAPYKVAAAQNDDHVDGGRVPAPKFVGGGVVTGGGQKILLNSSGGCAWGPDAGTGGFMLRAPGTKAYFTGCWTQQGHVIRIDVYAVVSDTASLPMRQTAWANVPDYYYP